jgi:hypothetical protein
MDPTHGKEQLILQGFPMPFVFNNFVNDERGALSKKGIMMCEKDFLPTKRAI